MRTTPGNPLPKILSAIDFPTLRVGDGPTAVVGWHRRLALFFLPEDCRLNVVGKPQNCQGDGCHLPMQLS